MGTLVLHALRTANSPNSSYFSVFSLWSEFWMFCAILLTCLFLALKFRSQLSDIKIFSQNQKLKKIRLSFVTSQHHKHQQFAVYRDRQRGPTVWSPLTDFNRQVLIDANCNCSSPHCLTLPSMDLTDQQTKKSQTLHVDQPDPVVLWFMDHLSSCGPPTHDPSEDGVLHV